MSNQLLVFRGTEPCAQRILGAQAIELGSAPECDLRLDHPDVPARAYLVQERFGTVWLYDLVRGTPAELMPLDRPVAFGPFMMVRRRVEVGAPEGSDRATLPVIAPQEPVARWTLWVGKAGEGRRIQISDRPCAVGQSKHNDLVLHDPAVSQFHCRFEPGGGRLWLRDLGSTNGTHVQGLRVSRVELGTGARVRVGRTDLIVLSTEDVRETGRKVVAASQGMQRVVFECAQFGRLSWPVLLLGPSGSGKEELAHLVHRESARVGKPFVAINAGGLPRELIESELFGHEKGAFTGAVAQRKGAFEQADGGTLFLDEIGELPLDLQARLLRVLECWQIRRVGGEQSFSVDVRLVCATHCDLPRMVAEGRFRQDLYWRLAHFVVKVPPLSERPDDVVPLAEHFLSRLTPELGTRLLSDDAKARLLTHAWEGNARELRNVLTVAAAMSPGALLEASDVSAAIQRSSGPSLPQPRLDDAALEHALKLYRGNVSAAARALDVPRSTLRDRMRKGG